MGEMARERADERLFSSLRFFWKVEFTSDIRDRIASTPRRRRGRSRVPRVELRRPLSPNLADISPRLFGLTPSTERRALPRPHDHEGRDARRGVSRAPVEDDGKHVVLALDALVPRGTRVSDRAPPVSAPSETPSGSRGGGREVFARVSGSPSRRVRIRARERGVRASAREDGVDSAFKKKN